ncbi:hypothetical protein HY994_05250 [Candidatus Micrarchaeota archaeon]|nr:hypothetical protein [Candidatus Micrarchaeota archaeon]
MKEGITSHRSLFETIYHSNPDGLDSGKTAAHVVLYGKLKPGATAEKVRNALASQISHPDLNLQSVYAVHYPLHNVVVFGLGGRVDQEKHYDELEKEWLNGRPK